jgi:hypothetical protein
MALQIRFSALESTRNLLRMYISLPTRQQLSVFRFKRLDGWALAQLTPTPGAN